MQKSSTKVWSTLKVEDNDDVQRRCLVCTFSVSSMAKKSCWFGWLSRLFICQGKPRPEKKSRRSGWPVWRLAFRRNPAPQLPSLERTVNEATEKQRKYALTVALATTAAAEAAVAAAQAAAEVVRLTGMSGSHRHFTTGDQNLAATRIQSAFRAYLARKALRALKGLVRLQAIVRGRAVRQRVAMKSKHVQPFNTKRQLEARQKITHKSDVHDKCSDVATQVKLVTSNAKRQSEDQQRIMPKFDGLQKCDEDKQFFMSNYWENKGQSIGLKNWDYSMLSKEDLEDLWSKKQEATLKRLRMMRYSFSHRESRNSQMLEQSLSNKESSSQGHWIEDWIDREANRRGWMENLKPVASSSTHIGIGGALKMGSLQRHDYTEPLNSPVLLPRRSFSRTHRSAEGEQNSVPNSPIFPTYMATTESARAKARSMSTPKQRVGLHDGSSFDHAHKSGNGTPFWPTYNVESCGTFTASGSSQHIFIGRDWHH